MVRACNFVEFMPTIADFRLPADTVEVGWR